VKRTLPGYSIRRICRVRGLDEELVGRIKALIEQYPTFGYGMVWAMLPSGRPKARPKKAHWGLKRKHWLVHQRVATPGPVQPNARAWRPQVTCAGLRT
jgi:hypothetical protein